jgi:hypothetical protein
MQENKKLVIFLDQVGRTIIGEDTETGGTSHVKVRNPAVVNITPNPQTGQISLQLLPLFFREFLADLDEPTIWNYNKSSITTCDNLNLDFKFIAQYHQIFGGGQPAPKEPSVIKLFDE